MQVIKTFNQYLVSTGGLLMTFDAIALNKQGGLNLRLRGRSRGAINSNSKTVFIDELKNAECSK
jgi:hypothetical protein